MKYLIRDWGIEKFRTVTEQYYGKSFEAFKELPEWEFFPYVGWGDQVSCAEFSLTCPLVCCVLAPLVSALPLKQCLPCSPLCVSQGDGRLYLGCGNSAGPLGVSGLREAVLQLPRDSSLCVCLRATGS